MRGEPASGVLVEHIPTYSAGGARQEYVSRDISLDESNIDELGTKMVREPFACHSWLGAAARRLPLQIREAVRFMVASPGLRSALGDFMTEPSETVPMPRIPHYHWHSAWSRGGALGVLDEVQRRTPVFFLSYAHPGKSRRQGPPREANKLVLSFFDDLSDNVALLVARPAGADPGFMDGSVPAGGRWTSELLTAVGTCQVFVALLSVPYFSSPWCGREWHAFAQRTVVRHSATDSEYRTGFFPVIWAPVSPDQVPVPIQNIQRFSPAGLPDIDIREQYETNGVFGLTKIRGHEAYDAVVWRLAQCIADFLRYHRVEPRTLAKDELHDIFREQGP